LASLSKIVTFFLIYPLENSLRDILELHGVGHYLTDNSNHTLQQNDPDVINDISDGELFTGNIPATISLSCNSFQVFKQVIVAGILCH